MTLIFLGTRLDGIVSAGSVSIYRSRLTNIEISITKIEQPAKIGQCDIAMTRKLHIQQYSYIFLGVNFGLYALPSLSSTV